MELEEIVEVLGKMDNRHYIMRRYIDEASSIMKCYMRYIIELYDVSINNEEVHKECLFEANAVGKWTDYTKQELIDKVEKLFVKRLFEWVKKGEAKNGI